MTIRSTRKIGLLLALFLFIVMGLSIIPDLHYEPRVVDRPETFEEFYREKLNESKAQNARPGNEEKLLRISQKKTEIAFLYIHGFGASRAEGEEVMDRLAKRFGANLYYLRLPGHGTTREDHATVTFQDYIAEAEEALQMMPLLGDRVVVFGTSMGGLLTTYLAAHHPDKISGVVLVSPFYDFVNKGGKLAAYPGMVAVMNLVMGKIRPAGDENDPPPNNKLPGYNDYWYTKQYYAALRPLARLRKFVVRQSIFARITIPAMMLYYYRDENNQDSSAEVRTMLESFSSFGSASEPHPLNRAINVTDTEHVMMSKYVRSNKDRVEKEVSRFLEELIAWDRKESMKNPDRFDSRKNKDGKNKKREKRH